MLKDVIVFPRTGSEALADLLSGGDYDGDQAWVCWEPSIVENFENASVPDIPDLMKLGYLRKEKGTFGEVLSKTSHDLDTAVTRLVADGFSFNMQDQMLGICTSHKEKYCYHVGRVDDERAFLLSSLLSALVDQAKQGIVFGWKEWNRLQKEQLGGIARLDKPAYKTGNRPVGDHVLDHLKFGVAIPTVKQHLKSFRGFLDGVVAHSFDQDLVRHAKKLDLEELKDVMMRLEFDLEALHSEWQVQMGKLGKADDKGYRERALAMYDRWRSIQPLSTPRNPAILQAVLGPEEELQREEWLLIKASKTFQRFHQFTKFPWAMAGRELQRIKGQAAQGNTGSRGFPGAVVVTMPLYASLRPDKILVSARATMLKGREDDSSFGAVEFDEETGVQVDDA